MTKHAFFIVACAVLISSMVQAQSRAKTQHRSASPRPSSTFQVRDGRLYDPCGEETILRGVNHPTMYVDREGAAMVEIGRTGANAVRLFWYAGHRVPLSKAEIAIRAAIENRLVPILEMHDSTCGWDLSKIVSYWTSAESVALVKKYQRHLIVNLANEPSPPDGPTMVEGYRKAIKALRRAGIRVPIMIDSPDCGRDYLTLLAHAKEIAAADPRHNIIFSAHLYDPLTPQQISDVFAGYSQARQAFIVGEFANKQPGCGADLNYAAILSEADKHRVGWLAWSWGDDSADTQWNTDCGDFDMTDTFEYASLRGWGREVAVTLPGSLLRSTTRPWSVEFGGLCH